MNYSYLKTYRALVLVSLAGCGSQDGCSDDLSKVIGVEVGDLFGDLQLNIDVNSAISEFHSADNVDELNQKSGSNNASSSDYLLSDIRPKLILFDLGEGINAKFSFWGINENDDRDHLNLSEIDNFSLESKGEPVKLEDIWYAGLTEYTEEPIQFEIYRSSEDNSLMANVIMPEPFSIISPMPDVIFIATDTVIINWDIEEILEPEQINLILKCPSHPYGILNEVNAQIKSDEGISFRIEDAVYQSIRPYEEESDLPQEECELLIEVEMQSIGELDHIFRGGYIVGVQRRVLSVRYNGAD